MKLYEQYLQSTSIYHYVFDDKLIHKILSSGKLFPVNRIKDEKRIKDYANRALEYKLTGSNVNNSDIENAEIYWRHVYQEFYEPVIKKPYRNYGIYMTTIDLVGITSVKYRFVFNFDDLDGDTVFQVGKNNIRLLNSENQLSIFNKPYLDHDKVKRIWDTTRKLKFTRLPQIVNFSDSIKVSNENLEIL